jgi:hypothetical protein
MSQFFTGSEGGGTLPPTVATSYKTDDGNSAVPALNVLTVAGGANINTTSSGSTVTINVNNQILQPNGSNSAPSYSFVNQPGAGIYWNGSQIVFAQGGNDYLKLNGSGMNIASGTIFNASKMIFQSGIAYNYIQPGAYPYNIQAGQDYFVSVDTTTARTIRLPNGGDTGITYIVKDRTGTAGAHNITVTTVGGTVLIDGSTTYTIATNFGFSQFLFNGTSWEIY